MTCYSPEHYNVIGTCCGRSTRCRRTALSMAPSGRIFRTLRPRTMRAWDASVNHQVLVQNPSCLNGKSAMFFRLLTATEHHSGHITSESEVEPGNQVGASGEEWLCAHCRCSWRTPTAAGTAAVAVAAEGRAAQRGCASRQRQQVPSAPSAPGLRA